MLGGLLQHFFIMKLLFVLLLLPAFLYAQIQNISNQKTFGTNFNEGSKTKVIDGFIYSLISPENSGISQDKTVAGFGSYDGWFVKMDVNFNVLNQSVYGGTSIDGGVDFVQCANGDFLILMLSYSGTDGNKTVPSFSTDFTCDYWLLRVDSLGNILWQKSYGGSGNDSPYRIVKMHDNKFALCGLSTSQISGNKTVANFGGSNCWVVYVDGQGSILNQFIYGGVDGEYFTDVKLSNDSSKLVFGFTSFSGISGNKTSLLKGYTDGWVITTDTLGAILNQASYSNGSETFTYLRSLGIDGLNNVILGLSGEPGIGGDKTVPGFGTLNEDAWIVKLDDDLNELNQFVYGGSLGDGVYSMLPDGANLILCMGSSSNADGNKSEVNFGGGDQWLVCIDPNGTILWQKSAGGNLNEDYFSINKVSQNEYVVVGSSLSGISGNKTVPLYVAGSSDLWMYKLSTTLSVDELGVSSLFSVAPNPFEDNLTFAWDKTMTNVHIEIVNASGQIVERFEVLEGFVFEWKGNSVPSGVYHYTVSSDSGMRRGKIVKK